MTKIGGIIGALREGWATVPDLITRTGWKRATLQAAISVHARKLGLKIERKRENGVTSYRAVEQ